MAKTLFPGPIDCEDSLQHKRDQYNRRTALLSDIPYDPEQSTAVIIRQRVVQANEVLLEYLESAVQSLREPSFYTLDCQGPVRVFAEVAMVRIDKAGKLKRVFRLSEA